MRGERKNLAADEWRTRRVMQLYAAGEPIDRIATMVGLSEGRVRRVLREAGVIVTDQDRGGGRDN